jgi:hypothetical protein
LAYRKLVYFNKGVNLIKKIFKKWVAVLLYWVVKKIDCLINVWMEGDKKHDYRCMWIWWYWV